MKHLKKYKDIEYNVGDYVYLNPDYFTDKIPKRGKIIKNDNSKVPYSILIDTNEEFWASQKMILRMMIDDEIEQYKIELSSKKYNL